MQWVRVALAALVASQTMAFSLAVNLAPVEGQARWIIHGLLAGATLLVFGLVGGPIVREVWAQWRERRIGVEQFFLLGITGAFLASVYASITGIGAVFYEVVAILLAIYTFGTILAKRRREAALQTGERLRLDFEFCQKVSGNGSLHRISVREIQPGDILEVTAGEGIPVDGKVLNASAFVEETILTGEPFPVVKRRGDNVLAGSRLIDQTIRIEASSRGEGRKLDGLIRSLQAAQADRSPMQTEADRLVGWFLPVVLSVATFTFAMWTWKSGWMVGTFNALAVLVVACPCAMGLATPIGIWGALNHLARLGLVPRRSGLVDGLARVDTVVFDKTGTLSEETLSVVDFRSAPGLDRNRIRTLVATVQRQAHHPVAMAFQSWSPFARENFEVTDLETIPGVGISAHVTTCCGERVRLRLGNSGLISGPLPDWARSGITSPQLQSQETLREVWIELDGKPVAVASLRENLRASASRCLDSLKQLGIKTVIMTGDQAAGVTALGLENAHCGLLPGEKVDLIRNLQASGHRVCFVGDGTNDTGAMETADLGIALASGSTLAKNSSAAEIFGSNLAALPEALVLCRRVVTGIRQNIYFAIFYNCIGIGLAAAGFIHPVLAALLMLASSSAVTWRALRAVEGLKRSSATTSLPPLNSWLESQLRALTAWWHQPMERLQAWRVSSGWAPWTMGAAIAAQGPLLAWLGTVGSTWGMVLTVASVLVGAVVAFHFHTWRTVPWATMIIAMLALGNGGMLLGWAADAGWGPVIRDGVCLCGCPRSPLGFGLLGFGGMHSGMLLASLPALWIPSRDVPTWTGSLSRFVGHGLLCFLGMLIGMELAAGLMGFLPIVEPRFQFFLTWAAMLLGMLLGMIVACQCYRRLTRTGAAPS